MSRPRTQLQFWNRAEPVPTILAEGRAVPTSRARLANLVVRRTTWQMTRRSVRYSPAIRTLLLPSVVLTFFAGSFWVLLPSYDSLWECRVRPIRHLTAIRGHNILVHCIWLFDAIRIPR
jgi:hypothetical protein